MNQDKKISSNTVLTQNTRLHNSLLNIKAKNSIIPVKTINLSQHLNDTKDQTDSSNQSSEQQEIFVNNISDQLSKSTHFFSTKILKNSTLSNQQQRSTNITVKSQQFDNNEQYASSSKQYRDEFIFSTPKKPSSTLNEISQSCDCLSLNYNFSFSQLISNISVEEQTTDKIFHYCEDNQKKINLPSISQFVDIEDKILNKQIPNYSIIPQQDQQEIEEIKSKRYYFKIQDLEYEEYEDFQDPSINYKQIKYPYQQKWERVQQVPANIEPIVSEQLKRYIEFQKVPLSSSQIQMEDWHEESPNLYQDQQQEKQNNLNVKIYDYYSQTSFNNLDQGFISPVNISLTTASCSPSTNNLSFNQL